MVRVRSTSAAHAAPACRSVVGRRIGLVGLGLLWGIGAAGPATAQGIADAVAGSQPAWINVLATLLIVGLALVSIHRARQRARFAEDQRQAAEREVQRLQAVLDTVPLGSVGVEGDGGLTLSRSAQHLLGPVRALTDLDGPVRGLADLDGPVRALADLDAVIPAAEDRRVMAGMLSPGAVAPPVPTATGATPPTIRTTGGRTLTLHPAMALGQRVVWLQDVTDAEQRLEAVQRDVETVGRDAGRLRAMLDALPVAIWRRDHDLRLVWVNAAYARAVDAGLDQVLQHQMDLADDSLPEHGRALARAALASGLPQTQGGHVVIRGERRRLDLTEVPIGEAGLLGYAIDQTALEEVRGDLERLVAGQREILEHLTAAVAIFGPDRHLLYHNAAYQRLFRLDEAFLETAPAFDVVLEHAREVRRLPEAADFPRFKREQAARFTALLRSEQEVLHLPDGTTLHSVVSPHPFGGLLFIYNDITDSLRLERNYNTLVAVQRESLDNLNEAIAVFGTDGRLRLSNAAFETTWGFDPETLDTGAPHLSAMLPLMMARMAVPGDGGEQDRWLADILERRSLNERIELADGRMLESLAVPLPDGGVLLSQTDVTDSVQVEIALRRSNEALETADRLKSEFIANVSYQLRTPLNAIIGFTEILRNEYFGPVNPRQREYTEQIIEASARLQDLVNDMLDLAMIEAGYLELSFETVDLDALFDSLLGLVSGMATTQGVTLAIRPQRPLGTVRADGRRLKQAFYNLLSNALKYTPNGGSVTLDAERLQDGSILVVVADTGIGIPDLDQGRVFGKFERGTGPGRHGSPGVGIGLALVKSFIDLHFGSVTLTSALGEGTTVRCTLPPNPEALLLAAQSEEPADPRHREFPG